MFTGLSYDEAKESAARWEAKKKELAKIDAAKKRAEEKGKSMPCYYEYLCSIPRVFIFMWNLTSR